jgi:hypothetical protein
MECWVPASQLAYWHLSVKKFGLCWL